MTGRYVAVMWPSQTTRSRSARSSPPYGITGGRTGEAVCLARGRLGQALRQESDAVLDGDEECRLLAQHLGCQLLETVDRRIFAINIVADFGARHRFAHPRRRVGYCIRTKIDYHCLSLLSHFRHCNMMARSQ